MPLPVVDSNSKSTGDNNDIIKGKGEAESEAEVEAEAEVEVANGAAVAVGGSAAAAAGGARSIFYNSMGLFVLVPNDVA